MKSGSIAWTIVAMFTFKSKIEGLGADIEDAGTVSTVSCPCAMEVHCVCASAMEAIPTSSLAMLEMTQISTRV